MTRRCSILPVFISGGLGAPWNMRPKASTGFSAFACSTSRPAQRGQDCRTRAVIRSPFAVGMLKEGCDAPTFNNNR